MKKLSYITLSAFLLTMMTSCEVIGGIFKAGVWVGVLGVGVVIVLIIWIIMKMAGGRRD